MPWVAVPPVAAAHDASTTPSTVGLGGAATAIVVVCQLNPNPNVLPCMSGLHAQETKFNPMLIEQFLVHMDYNNCRCKGFESIFE